MRRLALVTLCSLTLASCAGMEEAYRQQTCRREVGFEKGTNDGQAGKPMDSSFANGCDSSSRREVMQGYREGYEAARNQASLEADDDGFRMRGGGLDIRLGGKKKDNRWVCEVEAFGQTFAGFGASRGQAAQNARDKCERKHHGMHCEQMECEESR